MRRVSIVGNSGSGKSTLGRALASRLGVPFVELDSLVHQPGWVELPTEQLRVEVASRLRTDGWVVDGNYRHRVGDLVLAQADTVVWLDLPKWTVRYRIVRRTLRRAATREELWNGNKEPWSNLYSRDPMKNVVVWSWTNHDKYRKQFEQEMRETSASCPELVWARLRSRREVREWLAGVSRPGAPA